MLEEMLLLAIRWGVYGGDVEAITNMDVLSFSFMVSTINRIDTRERYLRAWTDMVSAQGSHKGMVKWTKPWLEGISGSEGATGVAASDDSSRFKQAFGRGI